MTSPATASGVLPATAHHDGSGLYVPESTPDLGEVVPIRVRVPAGSGVGDVYVRVVRDAEPTYVQATLDGGDDTETWFTADVQVHNPVTNYRILLDRAAAGHSWLNGTGEHDRDVSDQHDFRLTTHDPGPGWAQDAVVYQIFPDRFARSAHADQQPTPPWARPARWDDPVISNGPDTPLQFYGGDLPGITEHLDHLDNLGVDVLYLTPVFPAQSNHRYNATTFDQVDPLLGGDTALVELIAAAHRRGIRVIGDLTTNHSGDDHPWFRTAIKNPTSPERDFYYLRPDGEYVGWLGHRTLPKFDLQSTELRRRMFGPDGSVVDRWLRPPFQLDGWRIDVANMTGRFGHHDHANLVAREIRATMAATDDDRLLVAEHCHDAAADLLGDGWQGTMNYAGFTRPVWSWLTAPNLTLSFLGMPVPPARRAGRATMAAMREFAAAIPWKVAARNWNLLASHDTPRFATVTGDTDQVTVGFGLMMGYLGAPMIFAGEEWGLTGINGEDSRRPMPWSTATSGAAATTQQTFADLIGVRRTSLALRRGGVRWVLAADDALGFIRETADERVLVVITRAPWTGAVLPSAVVGRAEPHTLYGDTHLRVAGGAVQIPGTGPGVSMWRLG